MMAQRQEEQPGEATKQQQRRLSAEERALIIEELKEDLWREVYLQLGKSAFRAVVYIVGAAVTYVAFWLASHGVIDFAKAGEIMGRPK